MLEKMGIDVKTLPPVKLTTDEEKEYGQWNRFGMANGHLGKLVAREVKNAAFPVGLLANCSSLAGMLAGLQHSGPTRRPLRVGLVFIDAHGISTRRRRPLAACLAECLLPWPPGTV